MPPNILSSKIITIDSLNALLNSAAAHDPAYRFQLLSAKLAILTNRPSQPVYRSFNSELQILQCRLDLSRASLNLAVPKLQLAEEELGLVERDCKGILKRMCREERVRSDKAAIKSGEGGVLERETVKRPELVETTSSSSASSVFTSISTTSTSSSLDPESSKYQTRQRTITMLRVEALRLLGEVEEMQGRPERRGRWDSLAIKLEAG